MKPRNTIARIYAIGDIHGCYDSLQAFFARFGINDADRVIFCGDIVDRGPKIRETLDFVLGRKNSVIILGNHDYAFIDSYRKDGLDRNFYMLSEGLRETRAQLGEFGPRYARKLARLAVNVYHDPSGKYVFCHADYNWRPDEEFIPDEHLWTRLDRETHADYAGPIIVHGHTPCPSSRVSERKGSPPEIFGINLDGGCVYGTGFPWACLRGLSVDDGQILEQPAVDGIVNEPIDD